MAIEFELKFRAKPEILTAIEQAVKGETAVFQMQTTYYDTPQSDLSAKKYTLRRRMENEISVCTLKTPAGKNSRGEWETQCNQIENAIPVLCQMGAPMDLIDLTAGGVEAICGAKFTRIAKTVEFDGAILELALDSGVLTGGGREMPLCEVEVELKSGTTAQAEQYARILAQKFGLEPEKHSKFRRALALYEGEC